jgi:hypothetical protein
VLIVGTLLPPLGVPAAGTATYHVRQTVGDDASDGLTPATAWKHFSQLSATAIRAGTPPSWGRASIANR